jgi:predicted alpha/beta-fold hydrolase
VAYTTASNLFGSVAAHAWTIAPNLVQRALQRAAPAAERWSTTLEDPQAGTISIQGELRREPGNERCVVIVHGLGGSIDRHYCIEAAAAAQRAGISCLRIGLRGADRQGEDFYHAGLVADIAAALASPALVDFAQLYVVGYSLGGHVTLRYALGPTDSRLRAVAAVCAPLDLELGAQLIDQTRSTIYRQHVLDGLNEIYGAVALRRPVPTPMERVLRARRMREWDSLTVVPRYGFGSVENYYASMSAGPRLHELCVPSLLVQSTYDPMVPPWTYERHLQKALPMLEVQRIGSGGHVAFPHVSLDTDGPPAPLADQILRWFARR